jgi:hypothetical protein
MDSEEPVAVRIHRYCTRAAELRAILENWEHDESRDALRRVAESYEQMAATLASEKSGPGHSRP